MKRRQFIRNSAIAGLSLSLVSFPSCRDNSPGNSGEDNDATLFEFDEVTIGELQKKMQDGSLTAEELTKRYIDRIGKIDRDGPALNSVIELNPDALSIAQALDKERKDGKVRGPLHGIPVLIKDNIDTGDKMITSAGSLALATNRASQDAFIVAKLREAGAVLLGKTNLSEWANFRAERSSSGWSSRGGQTKNPYALERNPCGSSSGSGSAVSANLCVVAIGTETNGSIACPSSINGVVGLKPTVGLWSRSGIIPISATQDTAGPMTRTVTDAAILLGPLTGVDANDPATGASEGKAVTDYSKFLDANSLKGKRIGVEKRYLKGHERVDELLAKAMEQMKQAGAEVVEVDFLSKIKVEGAEYKLLQYEFKDGLNKYLAKANGSVKSLQEVIDFNLKNDSTVMPHFKQDILVSSQEKENLESDDYKKALEKILSFRKVIDDTLQSEKLDAICGPANGPSWCTDLINGDSFTGYGMYSAAAMAGYPHITVPMGFVQELPIGLCFFNSAYQEGALISIAYAYEQVSKNRRAPKFLKRVMVENFRKIL